VKGVVRIAPQRNRLRLRRLEPYHLAVDHDDLLSVIARVRPHLSTCLGRELVVSKLSLDAGDLLPIIFNGLPEANVAVTRADAVPIQCLALLGRETLKGLSRLSKLVTVLDDAVRRHRGNIEKNPLSSNIERWEMVPTCRHRSSSL
jgi:hypothetical protein